MLVSYKTIGRNIRSARLAAGLTQEQAAERMKISLLHFGRLERGERPISLELLAHIARALQAPMLGLLSGCVVDELFGQTEPGDAASAGRMVESLAQGCSPQATRLMVALCKEVARNDKETGETESP